MLLINPVYLHYPPYLFWFLGKPHADRRYTDGVHAPAERFSALQTAGEEETETIVCPCTRSGGGFHHRSHAGVMMCVNKT